MKNDEFQVGEIIDEIDAIDEFLEREGCRNLNSFLSNDMLKKAVMMSIINIGELTKYLSKPFVFKNSHINFDMFREVRNVAAHKYGTINFVLIWNIIKKTLPQYRQQLQQAIRPKNRYNY